MLGIPSYLAASQPADDLELAIQNSVLQVAQARDLALNRQRSTHAFNMASGCAGSVAFCCTAALLFGLSSATDNNLLLLPAATFVLGGLVSFGIAGCNMSRYRAINQQINGS